MKLILIDYPHKPLETLYTAYRVCYSSKPVSEIIKEIESGKITQDQIKKFLRARFKTGHTAPLRQLHFVFVIEEVSRVLTAQFNRHVIGVDRCEMSQRYVKMNSLNMIYPDIEEKENTVLTPHISQNFVFKDSVYQSFETYKLLIDSTITKEDARYILPAGTRSREQFSMSFEALQRFLDVRLCECAQWEIREMAWKMYKIMRKRFPLLSSLLGVKCWPNRIGYCDEEPNKYAKCRYAKSRPHKNELMKLYRKYKNSFG